MSAMGNLAKAGGQAALYRNPAYQGYQQGVASMLGSQGLMNGNAKKLGPGSGGGGQDFTARGGDVSNSANDMSSGSGGGGGSDMPSSGGYGGGGGAGSMGSRTASPNANSTSKGSFSGASGGSSMPSSSVGRNGSQMPSGSFSGGGTSKDPLINADPSGTASDMEMAAGGHSMPSGGGASVANTNTGGSGFSGSSGGRSSNGGSSSGSSGSGRGQEARPAPQNTAGDMLRSAKLNNPGDANSGVKVAPTVGQHMKNAAKSVGNTLRAADQKASDIGEKIDKVTEPIRRYIPK